MTKSSKKAQTVSILGLVLSGIFCVSTFILGALLKTRVIIELSGLLLGTSLIWLILLIQFFQRCRAEQERLDRAKLAKDQGGHALFEGSSDRLAMFDVADKRLKSLEKWIIPISGLVIAIILILAGLYFIRGLEGKLLELEPVNPMLGAILLAAISFLSLLFSRYATGLSGEVVWRPLRAGGSYLLAASILAFLAAVSLALFKYNYEFMLLILEWAVPILKIILGLEIILTTIFDIYRPRVAGEYNRAAFDSRLLGIINEPGGILHTVSSTLDYQFGFKVSETWFYKLLQKAVIPLALFMVVTMYLMSTVVIVQPGEGAIIEHLGSADPAHGGRQISAGWSWKWPWPFEMAYTFPVDRIQQVDLGFVDTKEKDREALLWGKQHYKEEYDLLVAVETGEDRQDRGAAPVSIVRANVPIHYQIRDLYQYLYVHRDAGSMLEAICYRELTRFAASAKIEADEQGRSTGRKSLLGAGRQEASEELRKRIQKAADQAELGVEIVFLGMQGVHPPPDVAADYQNVVGAVQRKQAEILDARAERNQRLTRLAGSVEEVNTLHELVRALTAAEQAKDQARITQLSEQLDTLLANIRGQVYQTIREAKADSYEQVARVKGEGNRFAGRIQANQANPDLFKKLQRLTALEESLENIRKYVVVTESDDTQIYIIDLMEQLSTDLTDFSLDTVTEDVSR